MSLTQHADFLQWRRPALRILCACLLSLGLASTGQADNLPTLGDPTGHIISPEKERQLGQAWLRAFRAQVPVMHDALLQEYTENLVYRLAGSSDLQQRDVTIVLVRNPMLNAFAVPGGVIGVHTGLFISAKAMDEVASVLAHEIAHLSQRHFTRQVEDSQKTRAPTLAGLLTGMILAATVSGDAGMAVMSATQAAALDRQLRFSRDHEQEADRIGMQTLVRAGYDPQAFPRMFERMLEASRYSGERPPEFLLTHPVSDSRIADTRNRAAQYTSMGVYPKDPEFPIMQARIRVGFEEPNRSVKVFRSELEMARTEDERQAARYGLALSLARMGRLPEAAETLDPLLKAEPERISFAVTRAELHLKANEFEAAEKLARHHLGFAPDNYPLQVVFAQAAARTRNAEAAEDALRSLIQRRPNDPFLYYLLAEANGLAGNIVGVHVSRAEYLFLSGDMEGALEQLRIASQRTRNNYQLNARIKRRIDQLAQIQREMRI